MSRFREVTSKNGIEELVLLSTDELRLLHCQLGNKSTEISDLHIADIQSLKFYRKNLQQNGIDSVKRNFDYCSIEKNHFATFGEAIKTL